jgi:hypothetical protein
MALPSLPADPGFSTLARQQGLLNRQAGNQTTLANRPNQTNPFGATGWTQGPNGEWTQNTILNNADQNILDTSRQVRTGLMGRAAGMVGTEFNPELTGFGSVDPSAADYSSIPEIQRAMMGGLQPGLDRMRDRDETRMATQGLTMGSRAYRSGQEDIAFRENDAERKALLAGVDVSKDLFGRKVDLANLNNQTRSQQFAEALRRRAMPLQEYAAFQQSEPGMPKFDSFATASPVAADNIYGARQDEYQAEQDRYQQQIGQYNADQAQRQSRRRGLGGLLGTAAGGIGGFMLGGPAGAFAGAQIGSRVGGSL